ncbi:MAG TPA: hypothetical protein VJH20_02455 [Candidatus Nanoarchaeia archaeon]|nr:hypothetical protein [Candidatus Nanoarchaeia archaeon]
MTWDFQESSISVIDTCSKAKATLTIVDKIVATLEFKVRYKTTFELNEKGLKIPKEEVDRLELYSLTGILNDPPSGWDKPWPDFTTPEVLTDYPGNFPEYIVRSLSSEWQYIHKDRRTPISNGSYPLVYFRGESIVLHKLNKKS